MKFFTDIPCKGGFYETERFWEKPVSSIYNVCIGMKQIFSKNTFLRRVKLGWFLRFVENPMDTRPVYLQLINEFTLYIIQRDDYCLDIIVDSGMCTMLLGVICVTISQ